jgi:hypothetical protein
MGTVLEEPGVFNWMFEAQMAQSKDYVNQGGSSPFPSQNCNNFADEPQDFPAAQFSKP